MSYLYETREIGDYRISVYQDEWADCPCQNISMTGIHIWEYSDGHWLSPNCNWSQIFRGHQYDIGDALKSLVCEYVSEKKIIDYINSDVCKKTCRMRYDESEHKWHLEYYAKLAWTEEVWHEECIFTPDELRDYDNREELCGVLDKDDFEHLLADCEDIAFYSWGSQGDYANGFSYCDKERFSKMCDTNTDNWRQRALNLFKGEVKEIGMWMWGDVKGYVLEKKVPYKKIYKDTELEPEDSFDWTEVESCYGYFMEAEDLIDEVISEFDISEDDAA